MDSDLNWSIEITASGAAYIIYKAMGSSEAKRIIELKGGAPCLGDITNIQNYLDGHRAIPA